MKKQIIEKIYRVVIYLRLSDDDGDSRESDSISNQRLLAHRYLEGKPEFEIVKECVDDGFTGTNFNRPGFQEMMGLIENGEADCIVAKDLSRFGRDFSGVLQYVERVLPQMGARLILLNDQYDSNNLSQNNDYLTLRFKSLINDIYPADTSRSVRANLRAKMLDGQCVAPFAFYGYLKSPDDKHKLVVDSYAGSIVQEIFRQKLKGNSLSDIAGRLNVLGILPPLAYKTNILKQKLKTGFKVTGKDRWEPTMVRRILMDERYSGVLIQGKTTTPNHKVKRLIHKEPEEWVRQEDAIPVLIDKHTAEVVRHLMGRDTRKGENGTALLAGLVECADCGQSMIMKSPNRTNHYYVCSTSLYEKSCKPHNISVKKLEDIVRESIRYYVSVIVQLNAVVERVKHMDLPEQKLYEADKQLEVLQQECSRLLKIKKNLYESFCEGLLDENEFQNYKKKYDDSLQRLEISIQIQRDEIKDVKNNLEKQQEWMKHFLLYKDSQEVDRTMVAMLIKSIRIYEDKRVSIVFWYDDEFEQLTTLLQTANTIQKDGDVEAFLGNRGGVRGA